VIGLELAVEQLEPAHPQARYQMRQRDLRRIAHPAEHALPEEGRAQPHAIEPADEPIPLPRLDRMGIAPRVKLAVGPLDIGIDPRIRPPLRPLRARRHDLGKGLVRRQRESPRFQRLGEALGKMESIERQHPPFLGLHPEHIAGIPTVRHRKHAHRVSAKQQIGVQCGHCYRLISS